MGITIDRYGVKNGLHSNIGKATNGLGTVMKRLGPKQEIPVGGLRLPTDRLTRKSGGASRVII